MACTCTYIHVNVYHEDLTLFWSQSVQCIQIGVEEAWPVVTWRMKTVYKYPGMGTGPVEVVLGTERAPHAGR